MRRPLAIKTAARTLHTMSTLPFSPAEGIQPFLSPRAAQQLVELQQSYLRRLNHAVQGTDFAPLNLYQLVERTHKDSSQALLCHYASQAWNMDFWLQGLVPRAVEPIDKFVSAIERDFGTWGQFKSLFASSAATIIGSGWTWLVKSADGRLRVINTYNGASPIHVAMRRASLSAGHAPQRTLSQGASALNAVLGIGKAASLHVAVPPAPAAQPSNTPTPLTPILGLSMWEHAYMLDYGLDRERYIRNFWVSANWNRAAVILNVY